MIQTRLIEEEIEPTGEYLPLDIGRALHNRFEALKNSLFPKDEFIDYADSQYEDTHDVNVATHERLRGLGDTLGAHGVIVRSWSTERRVECTARIICRMEYANPSEGTGFTYELQADSDGRASASYECSGRESQFLLRRSDTAITAIGDLPNSFLGRYGGHPGGFNVLLATQGLINVLGVVAGEEFDETPLVTEEDTEQAEGMM